MINESKNQQNSIAQEFKKFNEELKEYIYTLKKFKESIELLYEKIKEEEDALLP